MPDPLVGEVASLESSVYGQVLNRVTMAILTLSLEDIEARVHIRKMPWDKGLTFPACIVSPAPETSRDAEGAIGQAVVHYRVMISLIRAGNRDLVNGLGKELVWRESVRQLFQKTKPAFESITGATFRKTTVVSGEPFIKDAFIRNIDAQFLLLDIEVGGATSRMSRTTLIQNQNDMEAFISSIHEDFLAVSHIDILQGVLADLEPLHAGYFAGEVDPVGNPWAPLAPSTVKRKGHDTILVDKTFLEASLSGNSGHSIREVFEEGDTAGLMFGTDVEYAMFHQLGTSRMPARPPVGISEAVLDVIAERVIDHALEEIKE